MKRKILTLTLLVVSLISLFAVSASAEIYSPVCSVVKSYSDIHDIWRKIVYEPDQSSLYAHSDLVNDFKPTLVADGIQFTPVPGAASQYWYSTTNVDTRSKISYYQAFKFDMPISQLPTFTFQYVSPNNNKVNLFTVSYSDSDNAIVGKCDGKVTTLVSGYDYIDYILLDYNINANGRASVWFDSFVYSLNDSGSREYCAMGTNFGAISCTKAKGGSIRTYIAPPADYSGGKITLNNYHYTYELPHYSIDEVDAMLSDLNTQIVAKEKLLSQMESTIAELEQSGNSMKAERDKLKADCDTLSVQITALRAEMKQLQELASNGAVGGIFEGIFDGISNLVHPFLSIEFAGISISSLIAVIITIAVIAFVIKLFI